MGSRTRIVALVRSPVAAPVAERQEVALGRLRSLFGLGLIDSLEITPCPWRVRTTDALAGDVLALVEEMESWASEHGRRVDPCLDRHTVHSSFSGEESEIVSLPVLAIARYEDDTLVDVYPARDGTSNHSVGEYLSMLESDLDS